MMRRWTTSEAATRPYVLVEAERDDLTSLGTYQLGTPDAEPEHGVTEIQPFDSDGSVLGAHRPPLRPTCCSAFPGGQVGRYGMLYAGGLDGWLRRTWGMACQETARMAVCTRHAS